MEISTRLHTRCSNDRTIAHVRLSDGYLLRCEGRAAVSPCVTAKTGNFIDVVVVPFVLSICQLLWFLWHFGLALVFRWFLEIFYSFGCDHTAITSFAATCIEHCRRCGHSRYSFSSYLLWLLKASPNAMKMRAHSLWKRPVLLQYRLQALQ